jgi:hypothetical protein
MFLSILNTNPGIAKTLANERSRKGLGSATKRANANRPKSIHHFSHQNGNRIVINIDIPINNTINMDRGIRACWMVLSIKSILP